MEENSTLQHIPEKKQNKAANSSIHLQKSGIPETILNDHALNAAISALLPSNYNLEIHKTIHHIRKYSIKRVALQLPEGLQMFATPISHILESFAYPSSTQETQSKSKMDQIPPPLETVILADVTYGACCIDDFSARALGCDLLVHYGHSCLVPVTTTSIRTIYVFVDIKFNMDHLLQSLYLNFPSTSHSIALLGTIQFASSLSFIQMALIEKGYENVNVPQTKPLSPGEVLGCTSPYLPPESTDIVVYIGDGRFHLESIMIANPHLSSRFYRYDPYDASLTHEYYDLPQMMETRRESIEIARLKKGKGRKWGVVLGTLGRQGNLGVFEWLKSKVEKSGSEAILVLLSELSKDKLDRFAEEVEVWIQTSCPRLSIDWGYDFKTPLLTPYEAMLALMDDDEWEKSRPKWTCKSSGEKEIYECSASGDKWNVYPMDFYAKDSLGPWTPNHVSKEDQMAQLEKSRLKKAELLLKLKSRQIICK